MNKKYELTEKTKEVMGVTMHQIRALTNSNDVGGLIEKEENLSQSGNAWVGGDAKVSGNAWVSDNAKVSGNATVSGNAWVCDNAKVGGDAKVCGNARVGGDATVSGNARVSGDALIWSKHHLWITPRMGSRNDVTTFFRNVNNQISVVCGCFYGTIDEFAEQVKKTHGDNKHAHDYNRAIQMAKIWIDLSEVENETEN